MAGVERFEEIEVRRIRIVDEKGTDRMILTIPPLPDLKIRGVSYPVPEREQAGIIFYTEEGTECGGLTFNGKTGPEGVDASCHLSFDQYEQDQVISIDSSRNGDKTEYGIRMVDRELVGMTEKKEAHKRVAAMPEGPEKEAETKKLSSGSRVFIGRTEDGEACINLMDSYFRSRVRVLVDAADTPRIEFLDESGNVTYKIPPD